MTMYIGTYEGVVLHEHCPDSLPICIVKWPGGMPYIGMYIGRYLRESIIEVDLSLISSVQSPTHEVVSLSAWNARGSLGMSCNESGHIGT